MCCVVVLLLVWEFYFLLIIEVSLDSSLVSCIRVLFHDTFVLSLLDLQLLSFTVCLVGEGSNTHDWTAAIDTLRCKPPAFVHEHKTVTAEVNQITVVWIGYMNFRHLTMETVSEVATQRLKTHPNKKSCFWCSCSIFLIMEAMQKIWAFLYSNWIGSRADENRMFWKKLGLWRSDWHRRDEVFLLQYNSEASTCRQTDPPTSSFS